MISVLNEEDDVTPLLHELEEVLRERENVEVIESSPREKKPATPCLVNGRQVQRKDTGWRRISSRFANALCSYLLRDGTPDSGSGIKVFSRDDFLDLPSFNHMHRFSSALIRQRGGTVVSVAVGHWSRASGASHYGTLDPRKYPSLSQKGAVLFFKNAAFIFCSTKDVNAVYNGSEKRIFADSGRGKKEAAVLVP